MTITTLYKYQQKNGTVIVSPIEPSCPYEMRYRLIADEGKAVTQNATDLYSVIDVEDTNGWYEVDAPAPIAEEEDEIIETEEEHICDECGTVKSEEGDPNENTDI
jgi:hypothetical protein